ncbi:MAG: ABC transporter ATP-binding protein [Casimicrobiaceae bacterium]
MPSTPGASDRRRRATADRPRLALCAISKHYPNVRANDHVDLNVRAGEIHAVLGENGAGKSTLMKIIYGVVRPDEGTLRWEGEVVDIGSPAHARRLGIAMVFQHFSLFETLRVVDNIALTQDGARADAALAARVREVSHAYGLPLDPWRHVHTMSVGERQRVEIVRCLLQRPRLLIMDEPTSVLTPDAIEQLFATLRRVAAEGCSILYISHKLDEIRTLCDRATILRDGRVVGTCDPRRESVSSLAQMMIGGELPPMPHRAARPGAVMLAVDALALAADDPFATPLIDITLQVRRGEILGIAGISGNGQRELLDALSGERRSRGDALMLDGIAIGALGASARRARGIAYVPEERQGRGAVPELTLTENALLTARAQGLARHGFVRRRAAASWTRQTMDAFDVRASGPQALAQTLSGGNLQRFIVGREIRQAPALLIAAQPTWGVDVGAALAIRQAIVDLRDAGSAVLVVSEDLDELFAICDRIAVITQGRLSAPTAVRDTTAGEIGMLMARGAGAPAA